MCPHTQTHTQTHTHTGKDALLAACTVQARVIQAVEEVEAEDVLLLNDADLAKIYDATDMSIPGEVQRYNIIVMSYRTGLRPDNLRRLRPDVVKLGQSGNRSGAGQTGRFSPPASKISAILSHGACILVFFCSFWSFFAALAFFMCL